MRAPDLVIRGLRTGALYMRRWYLFRVQSGAGLQLALNNIRRSDDDRALHDHRGWNLSVILWGSYTEVVSHAWEPLRAKRRWPLIPYFRRATLAHRLLLKRPVWTLWLRGPDVRKWGFWVGPGRWMESREYFARFGEFA